MTIVNTYVIIFAAMYEVSTKIRTIQQSFNDVMCLIESLMSNNSDTSSMSKAFNVLVKNHNIK